MRKIKMLFFVVIIVVGANNAYSQTATALVADTSPQWIIDSLDRLQQIQHAIDMVKSANQTVQYQIQAMEKLGDGDVYALIDAFDYQAEAVSSFSETVNKSTALEQYEEFQSLSANEDWQEFKGRLDMFDEELSATNDVLLESGDLMRNTEMRMEGLRQLNEKSKTADMTGQLQLQNQSMNMLSGELADMKMILVAQARKEAVKDKHEEMEERAAEKKAKKLWNMKNTHLSDYAQPEIREEEYKSTLWNKD